MQIVRIIPTQNMHRLQHTITEMNKRAKKLHLPQIKIETGPEYSRLNWKNYPEVFGPYQEVTITGQTPQLAGWKLIGVVAPMGDTSHNIVRAVSGEVIPKEFRDTTTQRCDHCNTKRNRKQGIILQHEDGRVVQVGSTCVKDYLGHESVESILNWLQFDELLRGEMQGMENERWGFGGVPETWDLEEFLRWTACCIRVFGWTSRTKAREMGLGGLDATADLVVHILTPPISADAAAKEKRWRETNGVIPTETDAANARRAIEWASQFDITNDSDYLSNISVIADSGVVTRELAGFAASIVSSWQRAVAKEEEAKKKSQTTHVGEAGKRQEFTLTVKAVRQFDGYYGVKSMVRMETEEGNVVIWWTGEVPAWLADAEEAEAVVHVKATVKKHDNYTPSGSNVSYPQTIVQRVALVK